MAAEHDNDDLTPPIGRVDDPVVQRQLERLWAVIDYVRRRTHELANALSVHRVELIGSDGSEGKLGRLEDAMDALMERLEDSVDAVKKDQTELRAAFDRKQADLHTLVEKAANASASWWKWVIGQAIAIAVIAVGSWMVMEQRMARIEVRQEQARDKFEEIGQSVDKIEDRLNVVIDRLTARPSPSVPAAGSGSP